MPTSVKLGLKMSNSNWAGCLEVVIRIKPLSGPKISQQGHSKCERQDSYQSFTWVGHPESRFTFDLVADENVTQEKLFKVAGVAMVENCMAGYNSCMFALEVVKRILCSEILRTGRGGIT